MTPGESLETALWADGTETKAQLERFERDLRVNLAEIAAGNGVIIGPLILHVKRPGDDRVPPVPDHIQGPDVRLIVATAKIVALVDTGRFTDDLEPDDLARLRKITRDGYAKVFPRRHPLTDRQCDTLINDLGPEAAADALRRNAVNVGPLLN